MLLSVERPFVGAFAFHIPRATLLHCSGLVRAVLPASVRTCADGQSRFPRNLGDPVVSSDNPGRRYRVINSRPWQRTRLPGSETSECNRGTAKRRKRSAAGWAAGSRSTLIVPMKPGNWSRGTRWREGKTERGCLTLGPGPGTTSEASNLEPRITVTTQDSSSGLQHSTAWRIQRQRNRMP